MELLNMLSQPPKFKPNQAVISLSTSFTDSLSARTFTSAADSPKEQPSSNVGCQHPSSSPNPDASTQLTNSNTLAISASPVTTSSVTLGSTSASRLEWDSEHVGEYYQTIPDLDHAYEEDEEYERAMRYKAKRLKAVMRLTAIHGAKKDDMIKGNDDGEENQDEQAEGQLQPHYAKADFDETNPNVIEDDFSTIEEMQKSRNHDHVQNSSGIVYNSVIGVISSIDVMLSMLGRLCPNFNSSLSSPVSYKCLTIYTRNTVYSKQFIVASTWTFRDVLFKLPALKYSVMPRNIYPRIFTSIHFSAKKVNDQYDVGHGDDEYEVVLDDTVYTIMQQNSHLYCRVVFEALSSTFEWDTAL
jgi:hypothetical protein